MGGCPRKKGDRERAEREGMIGRERGDEMRGRAEIRERGDERESRDEMRGRAERGMR